MLKYFANKKATDFSVAFIKFQILKFDFFIDNKFLLEYDGITHFQPTGGWNDEFAVQNIQKKDKIKNEWTEQNKIPLYRISNNDIYSDDKLNQILLKLVLKHEE